MNGPDIVNKFGGNVNVESKIRLRTEYQVGGLRKMKRCLENLCKDVE